ncbi:MmpS family protein [Mycobacterium sp. MYCO198283]|uniref:MmpS family transport accessory protein n=1 Tax=Mycobacterium sp. MYCO198283 TaxID=2883505 RepID=UPI001E2A7F21|nr:MmpS family transport accessory protein [Mycobacterium sp. MYCO198283]MCG5432694.1 MmpS family protein [Mycobacterium sp. MYCO198283]
MSGPTSSGPSEPGDDTRQFGPDESDAVDPGGAHAAADAAAYEHEPFSQAYSAPESEQFTSGPYIPADPHLYEYDDYDATELVEQPPPPRWPWVVGIAAIVAAVALVASVAALVVNSETSNLANLTTTTTPRPPVQDEITTTTPPPPPPSPTSEPPPPPPPPPTETVTVTPEPPPPPPPPPSEAPSPEPTSSVPPTTTPTTTTTPAGPRQITYRVTGTKAPGDIITVTYTDASGRSRTLRNVFIPWSITVTPISQSEVGSVQASSLFLVSRLNCSITTSDGQTLTANNNNGPQTSC